MFGPVGHARRACSPSRGAWRRSATTRLWASDHVVIPHRIASRYPYSPTGEFPLAPDVALPRAADDAGAWWRASPSACSSAPASWCCPHRHPVLAAKMARHPRPPLRGPRHARAWAWAGCARRSSCWAATTTGAAPGATRRSGHARLLARRARRAPRASSSPSTRSACFPKPARGDIPIWIGGHTPRALRRVVELGDGWHAAFITPDALEADIARLREECARQKRPVRPAHHQRARRACPCEARRSVPTASRCRARASR